MSRGEIFLNSDDGLYDSELARGPQGMRLGSGCQWTPSSCSIGPGTTSFTATGVSTNPNYGAAASPSRQHTPAPSTDARWLWHADCDAQAYHVRPAMTLPPCQWVAARTARQPDGPYNRLLKLKMAPAHAGPG